MRSLRLAPELIPTPCLGRNLHTALPTEEWDRIRRQTYRRAGYRCDACSADGTALHCHEVWAYDDRRHVQRLVRLQALCERCHFAKNETGWPSFALGFVRLPLSGRHLTHQQFVEHWCRVNDCDQATWERSARAAYTQWVRRSRHEGWVTDYGRWAGLVALHTSGPAILRRLAKGG